MAQGATTRQQHYYVPQPMYWPVLGSASLFLMAIGAVFLFNGAKGGWVYLRDAVKRKLPEGVPFPGKFRLPDAPAAESAPAAQE